MRRVLIVVSALFLAAASVPDAEAARFGGGKSYSSSTRGKTMQSNRQAGKAREAKTVADLKSQYPRAKIQNESTLRTSDGKIAKDPLTGKGRRIDHAVIEDGKVVKTVETTSNSAPKDTQLAKESRIIKSGGGNIKDRETGSLLPVQQISEVRRHE